MSLPPGFLDELRTRLSLAQVVGRKVVWDMRKTNQGKGDWWAPCPFHQEKSASFHVDDQKGYYYCFGCQAKGDLFKFVQETENVGFMEAVEILAGEAAMPIPARDPKAQQKADRRTQLVEVAEQALQWFRLQLKTAAAAEARAYLTKRGLSPQAVDRWEIGFAPDQWQGLWDHLRGKGVAEDLILDAGLAKPSQKGGKPYDTFRGRIIFPIRDARGRAMAFGGRAMDPNDGAKYLNSPETLLFDKGANLYNQAAARAAAGKGQPLIVAEGYMDVIALSEAGFGATVAPLGTAVTETQLRLLWRIAPEPLIALDGDTAGLRAAFRVIDNALPLLEAGQSLRFAILPEGQDPDDLLRAKGPEAMQTVLDAALPMAQLLWRRETEGKVIDSPERRAALDRDLRRILGTIRDPSIKRHYGEEFRSLREALFGFAPRASQHSFRPNRPFTPGKPGTRWIAPAPATPAARASALASQDTDTEHRLEGIALALLTLHPDLVPEFLDTLERMAFGTDLHQTIAATLLRLPDDMPATDARTWLSDQIGAQPLETLQSARHVTVLPAAQPNATAHDAALCLQDVFTKLAARRGFRREVDEAMEDLDDRADEALTWRLREAADTRARAEIVRRDDSAAGAEDQAAMSNYLQSLLDKKAWEKKKR